MQTIQESPSVVLAEQLNKEQAALLQQQQPTNGQNCTDRIASNKSTITMTTAAETATTQPIFMSNYQANALQAASKKVPPVAVCRGCCVKITSKLPDGSE